MAKASWGLVRLTAPVAALASLIVAGHVPVEAQPAADIAKDLRAGGYVLVMRHASSPDKRPDDTEADPGNTTRERQLDEAGRNGARAMGETIKALHIPIGEVLSSPTYRALETARLASFPAPRPIPELGDGGQSMRPGIEDTWSAWLRRQVSETPRAGSNTVIITQAPNIVSAFPQAPPDIAAGETMVFRPDGAGAAPLIARIKIDDWRRLGTR